MRPLAILLDNPILTKFLRTRLRRHTLAPWLVIGLVLCFAIVWAAQAWDLSLGTWYLKHIFATIRAIPMMAEI